MNMNMLDTNWCFIEPGFDIAKNLHYESIFALGTGYMTTRASIDEGFEDDDQAIEYDRIPGNVSLEEIPTSKSKWGTYMPVVQGKHPFWRTGIVNLPYYLGLIIIADGERLDLEKSKISDYCRWLDLKTATLYRALVWEILPGKKIELLFKRYMNPDEKFVCVQECDVKMNSGSADIEIVSYVDNNIRTNGYEKFTRHTVESHKSGVIYSDITTNLNERIVTASLLNCGQTNQDVVLHDRRVESRVSFHLAENEVTTVRKISAVVAEPYFEPTQLVDEAVRLLIKNMDTEPEALHQAHIKYWENLWEISDVQIKAEDRDGYNSQLAIRMAIYHLLRVKARDEDRGMVCPKGTTSEVYMGAVFWDMEIFIEPFFLYTAPEVARTIHSFRYNNLPAARELTKKAGYPGVRFPWMSSARGEEVCPMWEYADQQVHITSDVIIGLWHYYQISNDLDFLFDYGAEMIIETARYWAARAEKIPGREGYHIYGVMGPDEYKPLSNNNAYTNHSVKLNLRLANKVVSLMKDKAPGKYNILKDKLSLKDEDLNSFREVEQGLSIPIDKTRNIVWQCDHFETAYAEPDIESIWKDRNELFGMYYSQEKRYRSKTLKQADVVALLTVFSEDFTQAEKMASFDYYWPFTIHDSSNSMCHHQIVLANIGRPDQAYDAWLKSIDIDFGHSPGSANGVHCANVGGMWQEIVFGFCGMVSALNTGALTFNPCLPEEFQEIRFTIFWKQQRIQVVVTQTELIVKNLSSKKLSFIIKNNEHVAEADTVIKVRYK